MAYLIDTAKACADVQALDDKAAGLPKRGTHAGGGRHVDLDKSDPSRGGDGAGWTLHERDVRKHPSKDQYVYELSAKAPASLSAAEKSAYDAAKAKAAATLPADWDAAETPAEDPKEITR
jgi:hypothetical protein